MTSWLALVFGAACVRASVLLVRWYLEAAEQCPYCTFPLPFLAENGEDQEGDER